MRKQVDEAVEAKPSIRAFKVHARMCSQLLKLVVRISDIIPKLEEARPRCSSGIESLCLLNSGISKAKSLLKQCHESSVLYLAFTGHAILTRFKKMSNMMEISLSQIQNMVPVVLAAKISGIMACLRSVSFFLDPPEEEAGKILLDLIHRQASKADSTTVADVYAVASRLRISSQKSLMIENRSIKRLCDEIGDRERSDKNEILAKKIGDRERSKKKILIFFLKLLNMYGNTMSKDQRDDSLSENEDSYDYKSYDSRIDVSSRPVPPEEFVCPLSLRLMSDPVVIVSGQTYEKSWIQKWFDEGHTICPKTNTKLENFSLTPNTGMMLLILKWCLKHNLTCPDQSSRESPDTSLDVSTKSIASLSSSINNLILQLDHSTVSFGSNQRIEEVSKMGNDGEPSQARVTEFLENFDSFSWDSRCKAIQDVKELLNQSDEESWSMIPLQMLIEQIGTFLKDSHHPLDVEALTNGCILLLEVVQKQRNSTEYVNEDTYLLLASLLDTEAALQSLSILDALSFHQNSDYKIANSGALISILNIIDSQIQEFQEPALSILANMSSHGNLHAFIVPLELIPKLVSFLEDSYFAGYCIGIFQNIIDHEDPRRSIAETDGCIASIAKLLDKDSLEEQERAVSVLLVLCSQRVEYCKLAMDEGVIPGLVCVSVNGNNRAKSMAMELLRILRIESENDGENSEHDGIGTDSIQQQKYKSPPKTQGLFKKMFCKTAKK